MFARILVAAVTDVRRMTYLPALTLTLSYCVSWCTHISDNTVSRVLAGIVGAIVRHVSRITYTPKLTLTFCYSVLRGMLIKLTYVAPTETSNIKLFGKS